MSRGPESGRGDVFVAHWVADDFAALDDGLLPLERDLERCTARLDGSTASEGALDTLEASLDVLRASGRVFRYLNVIRGTSRGASRRAAFDSELRRKASSARGRALSALAVVRDFNAGGGLWEVHPWSGVSSGIRAEYLLRGDFLPDAPRARLRRLVREERHLVREFLAAASWSGAAVTQLPRDGLNGCSTGWVESLVGTNGVVGVPLTNANVEEVLTHAVSRETRLAVYLDANNIGWPANGERLARIVNLRRAIATECGVGDWLQLHAPQALLSSADVQRLLDVERSHVFALARRELKDTVRTGVVNRFPDSADARFAFNGERERRERRERSVRHRHWGIIEVIQVMMEALARCVDIGYEMQFRSGESGRMCLRVGGHRSQYSGTILFDLMKRPGKPGGFRTRVLRAPGDDRHGAVVEVMSGLTDSELGLAEVRSIFHEMGHAFDLIQVSDDWSLGLNSPISKETAEVTPLVFERLGMVQLQAEESAESEPMPGSYWRQAGQLCMAGIAHRLYTDDQDWTPDAIQSLVNEQRERFDPCRQVSGTRPWASSPHLVVYDGFLYGYVLGARAAEAVGAARTQEGHQRLSEYLARKSDPQEFRQWIRALL